MITVVRAACSNFDGTELRNVQLEKREILTSTY